MTKWELRLADAGCRITAPRQAVMGVLMNTAAPLAPQQILERARGAHLALGLVTVYRTLRLLSELNLVRRVHQDGGCHGYLPASPGHRHVLICERCARAVEFPGGDDIHDLIKRVEAGTGYQVDEHLLQLRGLCPDCLKTREE
jgi:Fur family ferric uptake transcriptional regulator